MLKLNRSSIVYKSLIYLFITCSFFVVFTLAAAPFAGPLQVRNSFPLFIHLDRQSLEQADPENSFSLIASHSSVFLKEEAGVRSVDLDMEISILRLRYKKQVSRFVEWELGVPFISFGPGILDSAIDAYHDVFQLPDAGRHFYPRGRFKYAWSYNDLSILGAAPGRMDHGDLLLAAKFLLYRSVAGTALSFRFDVDLPTGNPDLGYGNGHTDQSIMLILDQELSEDLKIYFNLGLTETGDLTGSYKNLDMRNYVQGGLGVEWLLFNEHSFLAQILFANSPFPYTRIPEIDKNGLLFSLGWRVSFLEGHYEFTFSEDINTAAAPDFTLNISYKYYY